MAQIQLTPELLLAKVAEQAAKIAQLELINAALNGALDERDAAIAALRAEPSPQPLEAAQRAAEILDESAGA